MRSQEHAVADGTETVAEQSRSYTLELLSLYAPAYCRGGNSPQLTRPLCLIWQSRNAAIDNDCFAPDV